MVDLKIRLIIGLAFFALCLAACVALFIVSKNEPAMVLAGMATTSGVVLADMLRAHTKRNGNGGRVSDPATTADEAPAEKTDPTIKEKKP